MAASSQSCPVCEFVVRDEAFVFCPMCSAKLSGEVDYRGHHADNISYLWERYHDGKFIFNNFQSIRNMSGICYKKPKPVRQNLNDFPSPHLFNLLTFSILHTNPTLVGDLYMIGKLIGYYSGENLKVRGLDKLTTALSRTSLFWKLFKNNLIMNAQDDGWKNVHGALVKFKSVSRERKTVNYILDETINSYLKSGKKLCFFFAGALAGQSEAIYNGNWEAVENKCVCCGNSSCEITVQLYAKEQKPRVPLFEKNEITEILGQVIENIVERRVLPRPKLGDHFHISPYQCLNYFMVSLSPGHTILSKHSGVVSGGMIVSSAGVDGLDEGFDYLKELFSYLGAGIISKVEEQEGRVVIRLEESVFSSGVNDISVKLDVFLAGLIEGGLNAATGDKWLVEESKCLASGNPHCEFVCKKLPMRF